MSTIREYDWLMKPSPDEDVKTYEDGNAMGQRILEWLGTPAGTLADLPEWGNPLASFKFEPTSPDLQVVAEMAILEKITEDIEDIDIQGVSVEFPEIDRVDLVIKYGEEFLETTVIL